MAQSIVRWYFENEFERDWLDFDDHLENAIQECQNKSQLDAERYARNNSDRIWDDIRRQIAQDNHRGLYPTFSEIAAGVKRLFWYPNHFPPGISKYDKQRRLRIRSRIHLLNEIRELDSYQFEALSVLSCKLSGASHCHLTPRIGDRNVDFFAMIPSVGKSHVFNGGAGPIRIVGQSKKHNKSVSPGDIREFLFTLASVHQRSPEIRSVIPPWFLGQQGPIIGWFITKTGLKGDALDYSNNFGIIHSDGQDLAEIITMSRTWQPSDGVNAPIKMMKREIKEIMNSDA